MRCAAVSFSFLSTPEKSAEVFVFSQHCLAGELSVLTGWRAVLVVTNSALMG